MFNWESFLTRANYRLDETLRTFWFRILVNILFYMCAQLDASHQNKPFSFRILNIFWRRLVWIEAPFATCKHAVHDSFFVSQQISSNDFQIYFLIYTDRCTSDLYSTDFTITLLNLNLLLKLSITRNMNNFSQKTHLNTFHVIIERLWIHMYNKAHPNIIKHATRIMVQKKTHITVILIAGLKTVIDFPFPSRWKNNLELQINGFLLWLLS